jgi:predicted MPP superfamily phosphohydrolase
MKAVELAVYGLAWVGHAALFLVGLNILYSCPLHRHTLSKIRGLTAVIVFSFPAVIAGLNYWGMLEPPAQWYVAPGPIEVYLLLCLGMCLLVIPAATLIRHLRPIPAQLIARHSQVVDVATALGHRPVGNAKHAALARLPLNQIFQVEFTELTLRLPRLPPAWDGLTLLHLSDLHFTGTPERAFYDMVLDRCLAAGTPDLLAITGDLIDTSRHHRWLLPLLGRLRWKEAALAILGNHDYWYQPQRVRRRLARLRMVVLGNSWRALRVRGEPLIAIGHEGPWFRPGPDLRDCPGEGFRLCLSHTPDHIRWARRNGVGLMLSGHNHGGQIRLPLFGSLFVPSRYSRRYDCGVFWEQPTLLYVSRGLGAREPIRWNCRPEVTRLILRPE